MNYGNWIEWEVFSGEDRWYYAAEAEKLSERAREYASLITQTPGGTEKLAQIRMPSFPPLPVVKAKHRQYLERLFTMIDVLCQIEAIGGTATTAHYTKRRQAGDLVFTPPSKRSPYAIH